MNRTLHDLVIRCTRTEEIRNYYYYISLVDHVNRQRTPNDESAALTLYDISVSVSWRLFDCISLALVAGLWLWKVVEYGAREAGWLERNLGGDSM